ncbi:MAG: hypothetical protein ACYTGC_16590, partial [Planctomycetota bacterium]
MLVLISMLLFLAVPGTLRADEGGPAGDPVGACCFADGSCVNQTRENCEATSDCCIANGTPGCTNPGCQTLVCNVDPFCCDTSWDNICAGEAMDLCGALCDEPGAWQGAGTSCSQAGICDDLPTGACCLQDNSCVEDFTQLACGGVGGDWQGAGSACTADIATVTSNPGVAIPDGDPNGVSDTLTMGMSFDVSILKVALAVEHTWTGDLCATLEHVNSGTTVQLISRKGLDAPCDGTGCCGCGSNNFDITLADAAAITFEASDCIDDLMGTFAPDEALAAFAGLDSASDWRLTISDNAGADTGTLISWGLVFCEPIADCGAPPSGACCLDGAGICVQTSAQECAMLAGEFRGIGTSCATPFICGGQPLPPGACCLPDGSCTVIAGAQCTAQGGLFQGADSVCADVECPEPKGACCFEDGDCSVITQERCQNDGGVYRGDFTGCDPSPCPAPKGACCLLDGLCQVRTQAECIGAGGFYQGDLTSCAETD